jgi:exoribonuclease-2
VSLDELTIEASVRPLSVLDAPTVTSGDGADEEDDAEGEGGDDALVDAQDVGGIGSERWPDRTAPRPGRRRRNRRRARKRPESAPGRAS